MANVAVAMYRLADTITIDFTVIMQHVTIIDENVLQIMTQYITEQTVINLLQMRHDAFSADPSV